MAAHYTLDGLRSFIGVVKRYGRDVVVQDVGLDDTVEELAADEAEFTVDCCGGTTGISPGLGSVVWESWVGMLEEGDRNWILC
jgi:hypothetical protein